MQGIRAVGFDLDGTLYKATSEINNRVRTEIAKRLLEKNSNLKDIYGARKFFEERYAILHSGTKILREAGYENDSQIMDRCLAEADVLDLIEPNEELVVILNRLREKYEEVYLITSSPGNLSILKLEKIGIKPSIFNFRIYGDNIHSGSKKDGVAFNYVLSLSQFPASQHIYVGDRKNSDILPAKKLGMKTVAVWSEIPEADFYIENINEIGGLLL